MEYEVFAHVYDDIMDDSLYDKWLEFTKRHLLPDNQRILELACGTGKLAVKLAEEGYNVTALDLSEEMLVIANNRMIESINQNELSEDNEIEFIQGNMLSLSSINRTYQAITCYSDSLCYMKNEMEVQKVFDEVYSSLEENGTFIFDVHSDYKVEKVFDGFEFHNETDDYAFLWNSYPDDAPMSVVHELSFYIKNQNGLFERYLEDHHERTYKLSHYLTMLEQAGFVQVEVFADFTDEYPVENSERLFFVARKG